MSRRPKPSRPAAEDPGRAAPAARDDQALLRALADPSFNPRKTDAPVLFRWLGGSNEARAHDAVRALSRLGEHAALEAERLLTAAEPPARARLVELLGRATRGSGDPRWVGRIGELLGDRDPRARRQAAIVLGKLPTDHPSRAVAEAALLAAWHEDPEPAQRRALAEALGKVGGPATAAVLGLTEPGLGDRADPALERIVRQALVKIRRTVGRDRPSTLDPRRAPRSAVDALLHCRAGLEPLVVDEVGAELEPHVVGPGRVRVRLAGPLEQLLRCRTILRVTFPLPPREITRPEELPAAVADLLCGEEALGLLRTFTTGPIRYRLEWRGAGHRRAATWQAAARVSERRPELSNDPTASGWQLNVSESSGRGATTLWCELWPRGLPDDRFEYRVRDVPAASHPTIAAALARLGGARDDDVVWDPFVGSGSELVERARLGPYRHMVGTDIDEDALDAARVNLRAARVERVSLVHADARDYRPRERVTLIITNPPMGHRLLDRVVVGPLLDELLEHAAALLVPGGRMVWASPMPDRTIETAARAGLRASARLPIDLGGPRAEIQLLERGRTA